MQRKLLRAIIGLGLIVCLWATGLNADTKDAPYVNPAVNGPETPSYWVDLGGLLATYGNYPAAIKAYEKALELDPSSLAAHYNLALAHMELGQMDQALDNVNKAIGMAPDQHHYYYARARILLLSDRTGEALEDFRKAADLGNQDAITYLQQ